MEKNEFIERLRSVLETRSLYRNPDVDAFFVSELMEISEKEFNEMLLKFTGIKFNTYLFRLRIEKILIEVDKEIVHEPIGFYYKQSGFRSKTSFDRMFKEHTGLSLQHYIQKIRSQNKGE